jgi:hypothetical protein
VTEKTYISLNFHRGPTLTGVACCGRNPHDPTRITTVLLTDQRDPSWTPGTQNVFDEGEWREDMIPEILQGYALSRIHQRGFYPLTSRPDDLTSVAILKHTGRKRRA